ncbi:RagB/SusD family nutrient uptake outer membrane protein [Chitinophaga rhizosphaerae]|uniref:RagB/SusD family nutrient uptake outer membrane protein n=1 Tax=Chitinophaga rhizosphaerae TaxID=1864947 RepID=UPI000F806C8D|nr:RagB/SusD family nutrient uptake outer membrane protein [Chitinophaga rhizosphaerae]
MKRLINIPGKAAGALLGLSLIIAGCSKDFLNRRPLDSVDAENFFRTASDLRIFVNGFYSRLAPQWNTQGGTATVSGGNSNLALDANTDMMIVQTTVTGSLNRWGVPSVPAETNGNWTNGYTYIRRDNYFLYYASKNAEKSAAADHYIGEGYFFRAWDYFRLLREFGGVPLISEVLSDNDVDKLIVPRASRDEVARFILKDLDAAIEKLNWKGEGEAAMTGRVNKESALALKARIALYEGSWEYFHGKKGTPFAVPGKNGAEFLQAAVAAADMLIARHGSKIFTAGGDKSSAYNQLFAQKDASNIDGVFLYKIYDATKLDLSHNFFFKILDSGPSITDHLVDMYLNQDGTAQQTGATYDKTLNELGATLDPRFRQTVWTPDRGPLNKLPGRGGDGDPFRYPVIYSVSPYNSLGFTSTGYRNFKGAILAQEANKGETDDVLIRYEEALLCFAEAKAILGTLTQTDLDKSINVIRGRVGMTPMMMTAGTGFTYRAELGFDAAESPILNEIRRERNVELALEGFRLDDLKRWAVYDKVINGYQPKGALLQESLDYYNRTDAQIALDKGSDPSVYSQLRKDGYVKETNEFKLTVGANVAAFPSGRINPWFKVVDFQPGGRGLFIEPGRDYLSSIPMVEIKLYQTYNATLAQNPGWN